MPMLQNITVLGLNSRSTSHTYGTSAFPYPNPTRVKGNFSSRLAFTSRLSELTRLQTETVKQESLGMWGTPRPSSACSGAHSTTSLVQQASRVHQQSSHVFERLSAPTTTTTKKQASSTRPKSAGGSTKSRSGTKRGAGGKANSRKKSAGKNTSSQSKIQREENCSEELERRAQSLCLIEEAADAAKEKQPERAAAPSKAKKKGRHLSKSLSSCSLSSKHTLKQRARLKSTKT